MTNQMKQSVYAGREPVRILQHLGGLDRGGIETWLLHVLRGIDRNQFQIDFLVRSSTKGHYYEEVRDLGSNVLVCESHRNPLRFASEVGVMLCSRAPYDVVHSHLAQYDGVMMWVGAHNSIPIRISHSHNDTRCVYAKANLAWKTYCNTGRMLIHRYSTHRLAASSQAAESLFGTGWKGDAGTRILRCGIDLAQFRAQRRDAVSLRVSLGIPEGARVIGHVGRFDAQKNHAFLLEIAKSACTLDKSVHFVLVGEGPLKPRIIEQARLAGLSNRITFLSPRADIPVLMMSAFDLFLLPSLHEGLPLVLLEAQAANLPCIVSDTVSAESEVASGSVEFLPLANSPDQWAKHTIERLYEHLSRRARGGASAIAGTPFDSEVSIAQLCELYAGGGPERN